MKTIIENYPYLYPTPIVLVGVGSEKEVNYVTVGDVAIMGINPAIVCISLNERHYSTKLLKENNKFSINIPNTSLMEKVDYCGIVSGRDVNKDIFETDFTESGVPIASECPTNLECEVIEDTLIEHRHIFIAKVIRTYISDEYVEVTDGKKKIADLKTLDPIIYSLSNDYYSVGDKIGTGYSEGKKYINQDVKK